MTLLVPITMVGFGYMMKTNPPETINNYIGYRTKWSKKSKLTWDFAHKHTGRIWVIMGIPLLLISPAMIFLLRDNKDDALVVYFVVVLLAQVLCLCLSIIPTEIQLRKRFDEDGKEKTISKYKVQN